MNARALVIASCVLAPVIDGLAAEPVVTERKVSVTGTAVVRTVPDMIVWTVTTTDLDRRLLAAKDASDKKLKAILGLREELGVKDEDLQTGYLSIRKEYERDRAGNRGEFKHYVVTRTVTIRQRDLKRFDEFLAKIVSSAEVEVDFSLESSRFHELRKETRLQALRAAREKASAMAEALGARAGRVLTIEEGPSFRAQRWESNIVSNRSFNDAGDVDASDLMSGTFAPGAIEIRVSIKAAFAIE